MSTHQGSKKFKPGDRIKWECGGATDTGVVVPDPDRIDDVFARWDSDGLVLPAHVDECTLIERAAPAPQADGGASSLDLQDYIEFVGDLESHLGVSYGETLYDTVLRHVTFDRIAELKEGAAERDRLRALNAKLVAALRKSVSWMRAMKDLVEAQPEGPLSTDLAQAEAALAEVKRTGPAQAEPSPDAKEKIAELESALGFAESECQSLGRQLSALERDFDELLSLGNDGLYKSAPATGPDGAAGWWEVRRGRILQAAFDDKGKSDAVARALNLWEVARR